MYKLTNRAMHRVHQFWHKHLFTYYYDQELRQKVYHHNSWLDNFRRKHMMTCLCTNPEKKNKIFRIWFWVCENIVERYIYWSENKIRD
jgi:hypothetical protein